MKKRLLGVGAALAALLIALLFLLDLPAWQALDMDKLTKMPEASVLYDVHGTAMTTLYAAENRLYVASGEIPQQVKDAFVAIEDARFSESLLHCLIQRPSGSRTAAVVRDIDRHLDAMLTGLAPHEFPRVGVANDATVHDRRQIGIFFQCMSNSPAEFPGGGGIVFKGHRRVFDIISIDFRKRRRVVGRDGSYAQIIHRD